MEFCSTYFFRYYEIDFATPIVKTNHPENESLLCYIAIIKFSCLHEQIRIRGIEWTVFASICEHASSAFIFSCASSDHICLANSEHRRKYRWRTVSNFCSFTKRKTCFLADSFKPELISTKLGNRRSYRNLAIFINLHPVCLVWCQIMSRNFTWVSGWALKKDAGSVFLALLQSSRGDGRVWHDSGHWQNQKHERNVNRPSLRPPINTMNFVNSFHIIWVKMTFWSIASKDSWWWLIKITNCACNLKDNFTFSKKVSLTTNCFYKQLDTACIVPKHVKIPNNVWQRPLQEHQSRWRELL